MKNKIDLKSLNILELNVLLKHLRMGINHLKKYLNDEQMSEFLHEGDLPKKQKEKMKPDAREKHGKVALTINMIFTAFLGAWLATASFIGAGVKENKLLFILTVTSALAGSAYFGYKNFKDVKNTAYSAMRRQRVANLQLKVLRLMKTKRQHNIAKIMRYLNAASRNLDPDKSYISQNNSNYSFDSKQGFLDWLKQLDQLTHKQLKEVPDSKLQRIFSEQLKILISHLKSDLNKSIALAQSLPEAKNGKKEEKENTQTSHLSLKENEKKSFLAVLIDPTIYIAKSEIKEKSWLKDNFNSIATGLLPTAMGGFGSLFIYFMGLPDLAKQLGINALNPLLEDLTVKFVALALIIAITLYFAYSFLHINRRSFHRDEEFRKTQKKINNEEAHLLEIRAKLNVLRKMKRQTHNVLLLFEVIRNVFERWPENKKSI